MFGPRPSKMLLLALTAAGACGDKPVQEDPRIAVLEEELDLVKAEVRRLEAEGTNVDALKIARELAREGGPELAGPLGPEGPRGLEGPAGPEGPIGPVGEQGILGPSGPPGERGPAGPAGPQGIQGLQGAQGLQGVQGNQGPMGPEGPPALLGAKRDLHRLEARIVVGPGLVGSAVVRCEQPSDLVITGGCTAFPVWTASLAASLPFSMSDARLQAGWQCDYRNHSSESEISIVAEVYCVQGKR